jgi:hypothetical protein
MLGADVPSAALVDAIHRTPEPTTVVLWAQFPDTANTAMTKAVATTHARLLVGGPGWQSTRLPKKAARVDSLQSAVQAVGD